MSPKLTLNLGLRYDFFPSLTEVHNRPELLHPHSCQPGYRHQWRTGVCGHRRRHHQRRTPVNNYYKNFGPRIGLAYSLDPRP